MTEFGITASKGRTTAPSSSARCGPPTPEWRRFLEKAYRVLAAKDHRLAPAAGVLVHVGVVVRTRRRDLRFTGLYRYADGRFEAKPALARYRASARRDQGG